MTLPLAFTLSGLTDCSNGRSFSMAGFNLTRLPEKIEKVSKVLCRLLFVEISPARYHANRTRKRDALTQNCIYYQTGHNHLQASKTLRSIDLSKNIIALLPELAATFEELRILNLERNRISHIDEFWGTLPRLTHLRLSFNQISTIPASFDRLTMLR